MKYPTYILVPLAAILTISCNQENRDIEENADATTDAIDDSKDRVDANAAYASEQAERDATVDKAQIEADRESAQAQLDADKKKAEAEAEAARVRRDSQNQ